MNAIHASVRPGPSRTRASWDELCRKLRAAWEQTLPNFPLHAIFILGSIIAGEEQGFLLPEAGHDVEWLRQHMPEFRKRAEEGNEDMKSLVDECQARGLGM